MVVDGGSVDSTETLAEEAGAHVEQAVERGRALQMNLGAQISKGEILYFIHGDTLPPRSYADDIRSAIAQGYDLGCYRFKFDDDRWLLKINGFFTRFNRPWCRGGDQSLFIKREIFNYLGGYREDFVIMEDFEFLRRAAQNYRFTVIPKDILVSARKYHGNNYLQVQVANLIVFNMFKWGYKPERILNVYRYLIDYRS